MPLPPNAATRLANFRALWDRRGWSPAALVTTCGSRPSQWSDLYHGRKSFGEKIARKIEAGMGLAELELDDPAGAAAQRRAKTPSHRVEQASEASYGAPPALVSALKVLGTALAADMDDEVRDDLADALLKLAKRKGTERDQRLVLALLSGSNGKQSRAA